MLFGYVPMLKLGHSGNSYIDSKPRERSGPYTTVGHETVRDPWKRPVRTVMRDFTSPLWTRNQKLVPGDIICIEYIKQNSKLFITHMIRYRFGTSKVILL